MKYLKLNVLIYLVTITLTYNLLSNELEILPINLHFFGTVATSKNILAYGNFGSFLLSTDKGTSWKQNSLNETGEIRKIINYNDTLWGILDNGIIIKSVHHGLDWQKFRIDLDNNDKSIYIEISDDNVFVRTKKSIMILDRNLNVLNKIFDKILGADSGISYLRNNTPVIYYNYFMKYYDKKLFLDTRYYDGIVYYDFTSNKLDSFRLKEKINYSKNIYFSFNNIISINGIDYFNLDGLLFHPNKDYTQWNYFFDDINDYNIYDSLFYRKNGYISPSNYFTQNNNLCVPFYESDSTKKIRSFNLSNNYSILLNHGIKQFNQLNKKFETVNNLYNNNYYSSRFYTFAREGSAGDVFNNENTILEDSLIFYAGACKSLLQTPDRGKSWELVSNLAGNPRIIINDSTYIFVNVEPYTNDICRTTDYGVTFHPTELGLDSAMYYSLKKNENGGYDTISANKIAVSYLIGFEKLLLFYLDESGRGFCSGTRASLSSSDSNFAYTLDGGKRFKFMTEPNFDNGLSSRPHKWSNIVKIKDKYLFSLSTENPTLNDSLYHKINFIDTNFSEFRVLPYETLFKIHYILADDLQHYLMFASTQDSNNLYASYFQVRETFDSGKTSKPIISLDHDLTINQIYEHNKDSVFFSTFYPANLYLYDRKRNNIDTLYKGGEEDTVMIMYLSGTFYLVGNNKFMVNTQRNNLSIWENIAWEYPNPSFKSVIFKGNVVLAKYSDDLHSENNYRFMVKKTTEVKKQTETIYNTNHFWADNPYPIPGSNIIYTKIYYDKTFDLIESVKGLYNLEGKLVLDKNSIYFDDLQSTFCNLIINCSYLENGIYYILIKHHGITDNIPVVISK